LQNIYLTRGFVKKTINNHIHFSGLSFWQYFCFCPMSEFRQVKTANNTIDHKKFRPMLY
jgi:hypothetical protein